MDRKLRIAILSAHSCPIGALGTKDTGGMSVYIVEIARELGKLGHTVDAFTRLHDPDDPIAYELGTNARLIHIEAGEMEQIHKLAVYSHLPDFSCNLEAYRKGHDLAYDLVFSNYWLSIWVGEYICRWWNVPHIAMFHTLGAVKNAIGIGETDPELRVRAERELTGSVHHIIAPTAREKQELIIHYGTPPEKIGIVPCGVNPELFTPVDRDRAVKETGLDNRRTILYVGRIDPLKGIVNLLEALPRVASGNDVKLVIVGGGEQSLDETGKLKVRSRELGIEDRVFFTGPVTQDRMPYYYSASDVCVIPSLYESFGLVALESLCCGTPVVANDVGDLKNIVRQGETGYVVDANSPELLAEKIDAVLGWKPDEKHSTAKLRESVLGFSWSTIAATLTGEFERVLDGFTVTCSGQ